MEIDISSPEAAFEAHINPIDNKRILFSGPFGIGKTYFLDKFFEKRVDHFVVKISPINYVLGSNADVFELLKYDVLYEILCKEKMVVDDELSPVTRADMPIEVFKTIKEIASGLTSVGKSIIEIADKITSLQKRLIEIEKKSKETPGYENIKELISEIEKSNFILKADYLTGVINRSLEELKEVDPDVKRILIIDDIDRIDPEHIFRLFNVFGAHFPDNNAHKFDFDKVIFVCDVNNIRSVFAAKYGLEADFNGYIDKFYSEKIFSFSNKYAIRSWLGNRNEKIFGHYLVQEFVEDILSFFILSGIMNLRELKKINIITKDKLERWVALRSERFLYYSAFFTLEMIFGSISVFKDKLQKVLDSKYLLNTHLNNQALHLKNKDYLIHLILPVAGCLENNKDLSISAFEVSQGVDQNSYHLSFELESTGNDIRYYKVKGFNGHYNTNSGVSTYSFVWLLIRITNIMEQYITSQQKRF